VRRELFLANDFLNRTLTLKLPPKGYICLVPDILNAEEFVRNICKNQFLTAMCNVLKLHKGVKKVWESKHEHRGNFYILTNDNFLLGYKFYTNIESFRNVRRKI